MIAGGKACVMSAAFAYFLGLNVLNKQYRNIGWVYLF